MPLPTRSGSFAGPLNDLVYPPLAANLTRLSTEPDKTPSEVADLAASCVRFVNEALGLTLDYTPDTLPILDHHLREGGRQAKSEIQQLLASAAGAYFGEVVRRAMQGARWHSPRGDYPGHRLEFEAFFLCFNPMGVAMEVLIMGEAVGWGAHFQVLDEAREPLAQVLEAKQAVPPEDYYTLSMRFEALEQVADLLGALESRQPKPRHFGPEVYRAACGEPAGQGPSTAN
jgi:hypothetical protein